MKLRWSHCVLLVRDLDEMIDFYGRVLGFEVSDRGPLDASNPYSPEIAFLTQCETDHHQIAFAPLRGEGPSTTLDHIAFRVDRFEDVKDTVAKLRADGRASGVDLVNHGNAWSVYFRDPEENRIEIFCDSPFHVAQPQLELWDLAMTEPEIRAATRARFGSDPTFGPMEDFRTAQHRKYGA